MTICHDQLLVRNFYVQNTLCGYFQSEFMPTILASPELVRFNMWPLFHPHQIPTTSIFGKTYGWDDKWETWSPRDSSNSSPTDKYSTEGPGRGRGPLVHSLAHISMVGR